MRRHRGISTTMLCLCSLMAFVCITPVYSTVRYVKAVPGAAPPWDTAYTTVAAAVTASAAGDEIRIAQGTYVERVTLNAGISLLGGYSGEGETRDAALYPTVLDGNLGGPVIQIKNTTVESFLIDGLTIQNGKNVLPSFPGGGIIARPTNDTAVTISNNVIQSCTSVQGGGIAFQTANAVTATISNNVIQNCSNGTANASWYGGAAIYTGGSNITATISFNIIRNNTANAKSGAFGFGGGISCNGGSPTIVNNIIHHNSCTGSGGGIYCMGGSPTIKNNTIVDNVLTNAVAGRGGGIATGGSASPLVKNNLVAYNTSGLSKGPVDPAWTPGFNCVFSNPDPVVGNRDYENGLVPGPGDISSDPVFADRANSNYHLHSTSTCIDRGMAPGVGVPEVDFDGLVRPQDGGVTFIGLYTDMGAYEYPINLSRARSSYTAGSAINLGGLAVTAAFASLGRLYIEMPDMTAGIRVNTSESFAVGDILNIKGTYQVDAATGEKYVVPSVGWPQAIHGSLLLDPVDSTQLGLSGKYGLLVRTTGTVTQVGPDYVYIDDGFTHLNDGTKTGDVWNVGVRVQCDPTGYASGDMLQVTAISSCFKPSTIVQRLLLPRDASEIAPIGHSYASLPSLKTDAGLGTTAQVTGLVMTATSAQMGGVIYVEDPFRCSGIRVAPAAPCPYSLGTIVTVTGTVEKLPTGELQLSAATVDYAGAQDQIGPLGIGTRYIGGAAFGSQDGVTGGVGVNNIGLLTVVWGSVTYSETGFFHIDDGCGVDDGLGYKGIKVYGAVPVDPGVDPVGKYVRVIGISSCEKLGENTIRAILTRDPYEVEIVQ